jgi:NIMA (never in mitosis gene a)-related kinase
VFLTRDDRIKLGDFGIARVLSNTRDKAKTIVGTPYYLAPELIENKPYSFHGDMWSLGVLLYEMCAKKQPFDADNLPLLALKIVSCNYPPLPTFYSKELRKYFNHLNTIISLVSSLLTVKETSRPLVH